MFVNLIPTYLQVDAERIYFFHALLVEVLVDLSLIRKAQDICKFHVRPM